jgi:NitT/TauT family transport system ATP-binding protein
LKNKHRMRIHKMRSMESNLTTTAVSGIPVRLRGIHRIFPGGVAAIAGIDLDVAAGEFVAILGPSGCGKSTLLRIIAGLDKPDSGSVQAGSERNGYAHIGYAFQEAHLLPWRNILRNVALPLELMGAARSDYLAAAARAIEQVGLADASTRYPAQLSGGMRMRVSLARALVTNPSLLLLDEPFAALDEITRHELHEQMHLLWRKTRTTVIFVTHSIMEAAFLAQRAIVLTRQPARMVLDHRLDLPEQRTAELRTEARFARQLRLLFDALERGQRTAL